MSGCPPPEPRKSHPVTLKTLTYPVVLNPFLRPQSLTSPFDPRKVGDLVNRVAEAGEQGQPGCALGLVRIVHRHFVEEAVDGRAQDGERGHGRFEVLRL